VLRQLVLSDPLQLRHFEVHTPSLEEIFIAVAGQT
jgi:ABC-type uncharacterized transport system ATPase subunit